MKILCKTIATENNNSSLKYTNTVLITNLALVHGFVIVGLVYFVELQEVTVIVDLLKSRNCMHLATMTSGTIVCFNNVNLDEILINRIFLLLVVQQHQTLFPSS